MTAWVLPVTLLMAVAVLAVLVTLVLRKTAADRAERAYDQAVASVRPAILEFLVSDGEDVGGLVMAMSARREHARGLRRQAVHDQLAAYEGKLDGEVVERIHDFFLSHGFAEAAVRDVDSRRAWRRALAAQELGLMADRRHLPLLVRMLNDRDLSVRIVAARSIGKIGHPDGAWALLRGRDQDSPIPYGAASDALLSIGTPAKDALIEALEHPGFRVRRLAIDILGELGAADARDAIIDRLRNDRDVLVRIRAAHAIGRIGTAAVLADLYDSMSSENAEIRQSLVRAIARIGARSSLGVLWRAIADTDHATARVAAAALMEMQPEGPALLRVAALNAERSSYYAIEALDQHEGVAPVLREQLRAWDPRVVADRAFPTAGRTER